MSTHSSKEKLTFTKEQARQTIVSINKFGRLCTLAEFMDDLDARIHGAIRHENFIPYVSEMSEEEGRSVVRAMLSAQHLATQTACPCGRACTFGEQLDIINDDPDSVHAADITEHYLRLVRHLQEMADANRIVIV